MDKEFIKKRVEELGKWYECFDLDGVITRMKSASNPSIWPKVKTFLPDNLEGMRILDIGCNAGLYSIECALLGAEVIGIERNEPYYSQALFIKDYFEDFHNKKLNIKYIKSDISDVDLNELGKFDYTLALLVLYHFGKPKYGKFHPKALEEQTRLLEIISKITDNLIVRTNVSGDLTLDQYHDEALTNFGFKRNKDTEIMEVVRKITLYTKDHTT